MICPRDMTAVLEPTPFGTALLVGRSLLLFVLIAGLVGALLRRSRAGAAASLPEERRVVGRWRTGRVSAA
jgi:hypothetical protein